MLTKRKFWKDEQMMKYGFSTSRRQLVPFFATISILNISTKMLTTNPC
jgi:hypothetical protein